MSKLSRSAIVVILLLAGTMTIGLGISQNGFVQINVGDAPGTLHEFCDKSQLIVDATVQSVFPSYAIHQGLGTDSLLTVSRVLKGSPQVAQFVVAEIGGELAGRKVVATQYSMMKPGERYILFLTENVGNQTGPLPERQGIARYAIVGAYFGRFKWDRDQLRLHDGLSIKPAFQKYEGMNPESIVSEILTYLQIAPGK